MRNKERQREYLRQYKHIHKDELSKKRKIYAEKTKLHIQEYLANWRSKHKGYIHKYSVEHWANLTPEEHEAIRLYNKEWRSKNREKENRRHSLDFQKHKHQVLSHYSKGSNPICSWKDCGWSDERALSIDHINGRGREHLRKFHIKNIYRWLMRNNFPEGFQVLCMNHQFVKKSERGEAKYNHEKKKKEVIG